MIVLGLGLNVKSLQNFRFLPPIGLFLSRVRYALQILMFAHSTLLFGSEKYADWPPGATYDFARILIAPLTASAFLPLRSQAARVKNYCYRKFNQSGRIYPRGDSVALIFHRVGRGIPSSRPYRFFTGPLHRDISVKATYIVPAYNALRALCVPNTRNYAQKLIRSIHRYRADHPSISRAVSIHRKRRPGEGEREKKGVKKRDQRQTIQPG